MNRFRRFLFSTAKVTDVRNWYTFAASERWREDGSELFYRSSDHVMAVEISTDSGFQASRPRPLFEDVFIPGTPYGRNYDISRDGRRFVMIESASEVASSDRIVVVQNWFAELEELLGDE